MPRLNPVDPKTAEGDAKALLDGVEKAFGRVPNVLGTLANSPAVLRAYLDFGETLKTQSSIGAAMVEQISLAVAGANGCGYCASAHTAIGSSMGLDSGELARNLEGDSGVGTTRVAVAFARTLVEKRGWVTDEDITGLRAAGFDDGAITEIVAAVALNMLTNYTNHVAGTEIDFPEVVLPR
jgi:uncharacterized peroxidase-related enzyme